MIEKINKQKRKRSRRTKLVPDYHCLDVAYEGCARLWTRQFNVFYLSSFHQGVCLFTK